MNSWLPKVDKLRVKLALCALLCACASLCAFFFMRLLSDAALEKIASTPDFEQRASRRAAQQVQQYVTQNGLTLQNAALLSDMSGMGEDMLVSVYGENGELLYDSTDASYAPDTLPKLLYTLRFADGNAQLYVWDFRFFTSYYRIWDMAGYAVAFAVFLLLFTRLIRKKLLYILQLERELGILEGGDLECKITVRGNDELSSLARGIDDMRLSFIERQRGESEAIRANQALISALSHDLRTPLTSLMGYIELMQSGQYGSDEQLAHFIRASHDKALRIKEMTDALFEYSVCAGGELSLRLEDFDAYELLCQLVSEHAFELERAGFRVELEAKPFRVGVRVDAPKLSRVFDNLVSNIKKYADANHPVRATLWQQHSAVRLRVENAVAARPAAESNRIGLKTCQSILEKHHGRFIAREEGSGFVVLLELPVWDADPAEQS